MGSGPASPSPETAFSAPMPFTSPSPASQRPSSLAPPTSSSCLQALPETGSSLPLHSPSWPLYSMPLKRSASYPAWRHGRFKPAFPGLLRRPENYADWLIIAFISSPHSISISQPYVRGCVFKSLGFFTSSCFDSPEIGWGWNLSQIPLRCPLGSQCESEHQVGPRIQILCFRTLAHWESVTFRIFFF